MNQFMIDIETLGNKPEEVILEIGATCFNLEDGIIKEFETKLNVFESIMLGFTINSGTITWWNDQGGVPAKYMDSKAIDPALALLELCAFIENNKSGDTLIWAKGFMDIVMLEAYYKKKFMKPPWKYYEIRDLRTALDVLNHEIKWPNVAHSGLQDAIDQTNRLIQAFKDK